MPTVCPPLWASGVSRNEFARGLYSEPPYLASGHVQKELKAPELFWIVKNGLKMIGMPSFGMTHEDTEIWGILSVVNRLSQLKPDEYKQLGEQGESEHGEHHHENSGS